jgi:glycerol-3-phosphate dehydrogenase (NAD+)
MPGVIVFPTEFSEQPIMEFNPQTSSEELERVCIIGSGNWGSAIATLVGRNCERLPFFESTVKMWVYEEEVELEDGSREKLTKVINTRHENVKYLPGIRLPANVVAEPDLAEACRDATLLIFVLPHQFLPKLLPTIRESAHPTCRGVSLIKGLGTFSVYCICSRLLRLHVLLLFESQ